MRRIVTRHYFRRRARESERRHERLRQIGGAALSYRVEKATRGPWRWWVVEIREANGA